MTLLPGILCRRANRIVLRFMQKIYVGEWCGKEKVLDIPTTELQKIYVLTNQQFGEQFSYFTQPAMLRKGLIPKEGAQNSN